MQIILCFSKNITNSSLSMDGAMLESADKTDHYGLKTCSKFLIYGQFVDHLLNSKTVGVAYV